MPSKAQELGSQAERVAEEYLRQHGLRVAARNWHCRWGEIDIVAEQGDELVFVEVKARRSLKFGTPEESFTRAKQQKLLRTAWTYLDSVKATDRDWRFDLIAIELDPAGDPVRLDHYENALEDLAP